MVASYDLLLQIWNTCSDHKFGFIILLKCVFKLFFYISSFDRSHHQPAMSSLKMMQFSGQFMTHQLLTLTCDVFGTWAFALVVGLPWSFCLIYLPYLRENSYHIIACLMQLWAYLLRWLRHAESIVRHQCPSVCLSVISVDCNKTATPTEIVKTHPESFILLCTKCKDHQWACGRPQKLRT